MFLPDACDALFSLPSSTDCVNSIASNRERTIVVVVTDTTLFFYFADTRLLACVYQRDEENYGERGPFNRAFWKPDSKAICVTANNSLHIFSVELVPSPSSFNLHDPSCSEAFARKSSEFYLAQRMPQINVNLSVVAHLEANATCVLSFKEELIVCLTDGWLHRLSWLGKVLQELSFNIRTIGHDQHGCTAPKIEHQSDRHVVDIAPFLSGISVVLNDGRAALLISTSTNFQPDTINVIWAGGLANACCCATNFKYRLIYYGCKSGEIATYSLDDLNGSLIQLFTVRLALKNGTEHLDRLTSVRQIRCLSPNGNAFAVVWNTVNGLSMPNRPKVQKKENSLANEVEVPENGRILNGPSNYHEIPPVLAIFSPFSAQWWCSLEDNSENSGSLTYTTLDWAFDGFQLWMGTNEGVKLIHLIHSAENLHANVMMFGSDRIYICPSNFVDQTIPSSAPHLIWQIFKPPHTYISANGPIKFLATDSDCDTLFAVAGSHGFCFYNFKTAKWRMFRKEAQEHSLLVTGGLTIFANFILCAACNLDSSDNENERIYIFNTEEQLDLDSAESIPTNRILQIALTSRSRLLTFDVNSMIAIYSVSLQNAKIEKKDQPPIVSLIIECLAEIRIAEFLPHPSCLISMDLTRLDFHSDTLAFCDDLDSLLVNISGHLLLLSPMQSQIDGQQRKSVQQQEEQRQEGVTEFQLHPPTLIASFVEQFWITRRYSAASPANKKITFLEKALWINAGCKNSRVWLPLSAEQASNRSPSVKDQMRKVTYRQNSRSFISRRIMLPIELSIYPLCIDGDYLACSASCVSLHLKSATQNQSDNLSLTTDDGSSFSSIFGVINVNSKLAVQSLMRVSEVFIHKLLKQLLKRNLGAYAYELATACRPLTYFRHILELLLHDLLDEEATSSEPIPDPLLPTAVSFLREFPAEYLQTIVNCARKTELAFWSLLFSVSHHPRQLFQMCLQEGQLDTATSCLVILHSMENLQESSRLAFCLLEEALGKRRWTVAQDIARFMQNISQATNTEQGLSDAGGNTPESPLQHKLSSLSHHHYQTKQSFAGFNSSAPNEFAFPLFSAQIGEAVDPSNVQRRRSVSGKAIDQTVSRQTNPPTAVARQHSKSSISAYSPPAKEKKAANKASLPKLNTGGEHLSNFAGITNVNIDMVLSRYASNLLEDYALRDLGAFASYLQFDLVSFFRENTFSIASDNFPLVLMKLHAQFNWPYPVSFSAPSAMSNGKSNRQNGDPSKAINGNGRQQNEAETESSDDDSIQQIKISTNEQEEEGAILCDWTVLGKIGQHSSKVRGTAQAESELSFVFDIFQNAEAFEWLYMLSIMRQDIYLVKDRILVPMQKANGGEARLGMFMKCVREGTRELYGWAQSRCPAYLTVMQHFMEFAKTQ